MNGILSFDYITMLLSSILLVYSSGKRKADRPIYDIYFIIVIANIIGAIADVIGQNLIIYGGVNMRTPALVSGSIFTIMLCLNMTLFTIYILYMLEVDFRYELVWSLLVGVPFIIALIYTIANINSHSLYYVSEVGMTVIGDKFGLAYGYFIWYLILWLVIRGFYRQRFLREKRMYILCFIMLYIIMGLITYATGLYSVIPFGQTVCLLVIIYAIQNPDEVFDSTNAMHRNMLLDAFLRDISRGKKFTLLFVRIPDVDLLYSSYGHDEADLLLSEAVEYLRSTARSASVFRLDVNTYVVRFFNVSDDKLKVIRKRIIARFAEPFRTGINTVELKLGLCYMKCPEDAYNINDFKKILNFISRTTIPLDEDIDLKKLSESDKEKDIIDAIKKALGNKTFRVFYQPIYSTEKKKIIAAEALIMLFDDKLGFISPEIFIPIAEREGFILKIGEFVFTEVCRYYSENKLEEKGIEYIEVNLSAIQCMQYKLAEEFLEIMKQYNLRPNQINFEITESSALINNNAVSLNIDYFMNNGVELSLDDYGTGYSNISYLYNIPFAIMKVDKGILWSADKNKKADITLQNIFAMAKDLKMRIVVEGVETEEQIEKLIKLKCDYFQGYYFSKPVNEKEFVAYLDNFEVPKVCLA